MCDCQIDLFPSNSSNVLAEHENPFVNNSLVSVVFDALGPFPSAVQRGIVALHHAMEDALYWPSQEIPSL